MAAAPRARPVGLRRLRPWEGSERSLLPPGFFTENGQMYEP